MNPSDQRNKNNANDASMMYSKSTGALLLNRLKPQNENIALTQKGGLNTTQPKAAASMGISHSTPAFESSQQQSSYQNMNLATLGSQKVSKLRSDISHGNVMNKTLSASPSAVLLSPNQAVRSKYSNYLNAEGHSNGDHEGGNGGGMFYGEREKGPTVIINPTEIEACKYDEVPPPDDGIPEVDIKINVHRNSFIGSLNLTQKQLHDLYKVPQTFFYLRIKPQVAGSGPLKIVDVASNSGSVYDLELISLNQVDKNNYFTLSKEGVTQFRNKISQFTGLAQWEREYRLFHKIAGINFFRIYKRWKVKFTLPSVVCFLLSSSYSLFLFLFLPCFSSSFSLVSFFSLF
jgi:hypothetical protein